MGSSPLSIDVYVAPMRPYTCPDQLGEGEVATWAPSSTTLISGPKVLKKSSEAEPVVGVPVGNVDTRELLAEALRPGGDLLRVLEGQ